MKFQAQLKEVKCKVTLTSDVEYTIKLITMQKKAAKLQAEVGNWVVIDCERLRQK